MTPALDRLRNLGHLLDPVELQQRSRRQLAHGHRLQAFASSQLAIFVHTARGVRNEEIALRAAALTYHTLLSIVPVLAVAFALFKAFGGLQKLEGPLRELILENLSVGRSQEVGHWLERFINNINAGAIAGVGLLFLFYSAVGLLGNIEGAFNRIWGIDRSRPLYMRFAIYWCVLTLAPPFVGLSLSLSAKLQSSTFATSVTNWLPFGMGRLIVSGGSVLAACMVLVFLYQLVPHTRVRLRSSLLGGVVAGLLWTVSKALFLWATAGSVKYSAVYGALGVLPLLMIWIYLSWIIVLFGVTYTYAAQSLASGKLEQVNERIGQTAREALALRLLLAAAQSFRGEGEAPTVDELSDRCGVSPVQLRPVADLLVSLKVLAEVGPERRLAPARALEQIRIAEVLEKLRERPSPLDHLYMAPTDGAWPEVRAVIEAFRPSGQPEAATLTLAELAQRLEEATLELTGPHKPVERSL